MLQNGLDDSIHVSLRGLLPSRREVFQQFLSSLIQVLLVFFLRLGRVDRMLGSTDPNKLLCSRIIDTEDESPDVYG